MHESSDHAAAEVEVQPGLAALSARVHGNADRGLSVVRAVIAALRDLDPDLVRVCLDVAVAGLSVTTQRRVQQQLKEEGMQFEFDDIPGPRVPTPIADAFLDNRYGRAVREGVAHGFRRALLRVIAARGLAISAEQRHRIERCTDLDRLDEWIGRVGVAASVAEVLGED